jgi:hypothetical protein
MARFVVADDADRRDARTGRGTSPGQDSKPVKDNVELAVVAGVDQHGVPALVPANGSRALEAKELAPADPTHADEEVGRHSNSHSG